MRRICAYAIAVVMVAVTSVAAFGATIALWNFNDQNITVDQGNGTLVLVGTSSGWETDPTKVDPNDPGGASLEITGFPALQTDPNLTDGIEFRVSTVGQSNIRVKWDMRHNIKNGESCPNTMTFQFSTDGGLYWCNGPTWTGYGDQWYLNREVDLSDVAGVANNPDFRFRLMAAWQPGYEQYMQCVGSTYSGSRKWRLDLIKVLNDPLPAVANTVALWDFNDQRDLVADYGDGVSNAVPIGNIALDGDGYSKDYAIDSEPWDSSASSDPSLKGKGLDTTAYPAQGTNNNSAGLQLNLSTVGYSGIKLSFDLKHKQDAASHIRVMYTLNRNASPVVWTTATPVFGHEITDYSQTAWWFNDNVIDLSGISGANNNPNFALKIVTTFDPGTPTVYASSMYGREYDQDSYYNKLRYDMIRVTATSTPPAFTSQSIVGAKQAAQWERVALSNVLVSATHPDYFWVQNDDRTCGIKIYYPQHNMNDGWRCNISGVVRVGRDTEKYIYAASVSRVGTTTETVRPLGLRNGTVGGGDWNYDATTGAGQKGAPVGVGVSNIGLLVTTWGRVTGMVEEEDTPGNYVFMYIDDGSGLYDGNLAGPGYTPALGVRVVLPKNFTGDHVGRFARVTGVSSLDRLDSVSDTVVRAIRRPGIDIISE